MTGKLGVGEDFMTRMVMCARTPFFLTTERVLVWYGTGTGVLYHYSTIHIHVWGRFSSAGWRISTPLEEMFYGSKMAARS